MNKNNFSDNLKRLYLKKPVNERLIDKYTNSGQITFFNWEFFEQKLSQANGDYSFQFDYGLEKTKTYKRVDKETRFCQILEKSGLTVSYWKIIPDEEIPLLWPEMIIKTGTETFKKDLVSFKDKVKNYTRKISPLVKVELLSKLIERYSLGKIYSESYWKVYGSFGKNYDSPLVKRADFEEDVNFRKTHYSDKPVLPQRLVKEYAVKMFAVYAAETSVLWALAKNGVLPNLVLASNESERAIKKYETLAKWEERPVLPKIYVL